MRFRIGPVNSENESDAIYVRTKTIIVWMNHGLSDGLSLTYLSITRRFRPLQICELEIGKDPGPGESDYYDSYQQSCVPIYYILA